MVAFALLTGLSRGELCSLWWQDIDLDAMVVHIHSSATFNTKHGKRRVVALNSTAFLLLQSQKEHSPSEYVFSLNQIELIPRRTCRRPQATPSSEGFTTEPLHLHVAEQSVRTMPDRTRVDLCSWLTFPRMCQRQFAANSHKCNIAGRVSH
jgi:integrase